MNEDNLLRIVRLVLVLVICGLVWVKVRRVSRKAPSVLRMPGGAPIPDYKGRLAFFRRHFNGDYSLARSYWVNTFLVSLFAPALGIILLPRLGEKFPVRYESARILLVMALAYATWFWAMAGTWASANNHVQRGGSSGWAIAAKFVILLGIHRAFVDLGDMEPAFLELRQFATGAQPGPRTKLEVSADGRSLLLSGGINEGSAAQLDNALKLNPHIGTVVLSSNGGWVSEGRWLAASILERGLNTYVKDKCASACTIAFLAGTERAAAPHAKIGFHAGQRVGSTAATLPAEDTSVLRSFYHFAGVPDSFARQVFDTPHTQMWYPSRDILLAANVLTQKSMDGETAASQAKGAQWRCPPADTKLQPIEGGK